jgi:membrane protease YdiL (CAAX protease family)
MRRWHRLVASPRRPMMMKPPIALVLLAAFLILAQAGVSIGASVWGIEPAVADQSLEDKTRLTLAAYLGQLIALVSVLYIAVNARRMSPDSRPSRGKAAIIGACAFVLAWPITTAAGNLAGWVIGVIRGAPVKQMAHDTLRLMQDHPIDGWYLALVAMVVFVAPVMEEVMYRGLVQGTLVQVGVKRWPAILITSAAFTVMHIGAVEPHALASLFTLSLAFGWIYERTGRLTAPIAMHMLFNATNLALARWVM